MVARAPGLSARAALALAQALPHPVCVHDAAGRLAWGNAAFALLVGRTPEQLPGAALAAVLPGPLAEHLRRRGAALLAGDAPEDEDETWDFDGCALVLRVRRALLPGALAGESLVACIATDHSVERLARAQLHALEARHRALLERLRLTPP